MTPIVAPAAPAPSVLDRASGRHLGLRPALREASDDLFNGSFGREGYSVSYQEEGQGYSLTLHTPTGAHQLIVGSLLEDLITVEVTTPEGARLNHVPAPLVRVAVETFRSHCLALLA